MSASVAALVLLALSLAPAASAATPSPSPAPSAATGSSSQAAIFGIKPVTPGQNDLRVNYSYSMAPNATYQDWAAIQNYSATPLDLQVYATDLDNGASGQLAVLAAGVTPVDAGAWVQMAGAPIAVHLPPRGESGPSQVVVPFTVKVPSDASPGDHAAAMVVSLRSGGTNPKGQNLQLDQRVASRLFVRVRGPVRTGLAVSDVRISYNQSHSPLGRGTATVSYVLQNTGNVRIGAHQSFYITGLFGSRADASPIGDIPLLFPKAKVVEKFTISGVLPTVFEKLHIDAKQLKLPDLATPEVREVSETVDFYAIPWMLLVAIVVIVLVLIGSVLGLRWWRSRPSGSGGGSTDGGPGSRPDGPDGSSAGRDQASNRDSAAVGTTVFAALAASLLVLLGFAPTAQSAPSPLTDPQAKGTIGLCSADGKEVRSGSVNDKPFVSIAASSVAAPADYQGAGRKATLYAYQPRPNTPATEWNGDTLTASSLYTNAQKPMAAATFRDFTLQDYLNEFPAMVDGLVQLRMYFGIPNNDTFSDTYPATVLKISGTQWSVVSGGGIDCSGGQATSSEVGILNDTPTPPPVAALSSPSAGNIPAGTQGSASAGAGDATANAVAASASAASGASATSPLVVGRARPASSSARGWWFGCAVLIVGGCGGFVLWRRRASI